MHLRFILLAFGGLAFLLYLIFQQLATEYLDFPMAIATFIVVCILLLLSLAIAFFAVSLIALPVSIQRWGTREAKGRK
jgi:predicted signal transduction protein with EAL and GGDEF domain